MTPGSFNRIAGKALLIRHPREGATIAEHVFDLDNGIAWLESGWDRPGYGGDVAHIELGEVYKGGEDFWVIESEAGELILDELAEQPRGDRAAALRLVERELGIILKE